MLLKVVADARNVRGHFLAVGQPDASNFTRAEFGFFGVTVLTWVQTPRRCGLPVPQSSRGRSG